METEELINYCKSRKKAYTFYMSSLKDVKTKSEFNNLVDELFSDIFDDENLIFEETNKPCAKPVYELLISVRHSYNVVLDLFEKYCVLHDFNE